MLSSISVHIFVVQYYILYSCNYIYLGQLAKWPLFCTDAPRKSIGFCSNFERI